MKQILHSRPSIGKEEIEEVKKILLSGHIAQGKKVKEFEEKLSEFIGVKGTVVLNSGSSALHLSLISLGIKNGDEVILPSYVCSSVLNSIYYVGAKPILCDIGEKDFNISPQEIKKKINKKTKAIIVPHMFGNPCDLEEILSFDIPVIEDCAHSIGASYKGKKVGSFGKISVFSFYATKMLGCGEGGAVASNDTKILDIVKDLREYDEKQTYKIRYNYKLTDILAGIGIVQLKKLPSFISKRKKIADKYSKNFSKYKLVLPVLEKDKENVFYRYIVKVENLDMVLKEFKKNGIICKMPVFKPLHRYFNLKGFPNTENAYKTAVSIPIYPFLSSEEIGYIIEKGKEIFIVNTPLPHFSRRE